MEIGERLREAREAESISLDSLQETTKIQKRYLTAIEKGNFHILPGKFYARAFIKEYALAVGLNPTELLNEFSEEVPQTETKQTEEYSRMDRSKRTDNTSKSPAILSIIPAIIVALLVIGIIFVAVTLYQKSMSDTNSDPANDQGQNEIIRSTSNNQQNKNLNNENNAQENNEDTNNNESESNNNTSENNEEDLDESSLTLVETGSGSQPESTYKFTTTDDTLILSIEPSGESWLDITNKTGESFYGKLTEENTPIELDLTGQNQIRLNVGLATSISKMSINGVEIDFPVDPIQYVSQRIWIEINNKTE